MDESLNVGNQGPKDVFLKLLGRLTIEMSNLEFEIMRCMAILLNDDKLAIALTAESTLGRSVDILKSLFYHFVDDDALVEKFKIIITRINGDNGVQRERNKYIHSMWPVGDNSSIMRIKFLKPKGKTGFHYETEVNPDPEKLQALIDKIIDLNNDFNMFSFRELVLFMEQRENKKTS